MSENEKKLIKVSGDGADLEVEALIIKGADVNALVVRSPYLSYDPCNLFSPPEWLYRLAEGR